MSDIHFGRCPLADEPGYRDFVILHLPGLNVIDGVRIGKNHRVTANANYNAAVKVEC
jgi:hypothetical protein